MSDNKFYLKIHKKLNSRVVSICDKDLINKTFESDNIRIKMEEKFYKGEIIDEKIALNYIKEERNLNLVGKKIISLGLKNNIIKKEDIIYVEDSPVVYLFTI